jgi:hypothetical protein
MGRENPTYVCPLTRERLQSGPEGLARADGVAFRFLPRVADAAHGVPDFLALLLGSAYSEQPSSNFAYAGRTACSPVHLSLTLFLTEFRWGTASRGPPRAVARGTDITSNTTEL